MTGHGYRFRGMGLGLKMKRPKPESPANDASAAFTRALRRELDDERGSRARLAFAPDRAPVVLDDFAADVEAEAEATVCLSDTARSKRPKIRSRCSRRCRCRDRGLRAGPVPRSAPTAISIGLPAPNLTALESRLVTTLIETGSIPLADDRCAGLDRHRAVGSRQIGLEAFVDFADECAEVDVRALQRERARIEPRDVEQIADEPGQPGSLVRDALDPPVQQLCGSMGRPECAAL